MNEFGNEEKSQMTCPTNMKMDVSQLISINNIMCEVRNNIVSFHCFISHEKDISNGNVMFKEIVENHHSQCHEKQMKEQFVSSPQHD